MNGWSLQGDDGPTCLGVTFDTRLVWRGQTGGCLRGGMRGTALVEKMAGSKWGAGHNILRRDYQEYVRPVLECGMGCWGQAASGNFQRVKKVQHQSLRLMTGGVRSAPVREMEAPPVHGG